MDQVIRIAQFITITTALGTRRRRQNYFINESKSFEGATYDFAPFHVEGGVSSLNGDNDVIQVLFPATQLVIKLVEEGDGNRKSRLELSTKYVSESGDLKTGGFKGFFIGIGASFSEDTVELRFRSALDGITQNLPGRTLTAENVGILPLESQLNLR
jgi:hypothetical protein